MKKFIVKRVYTISSGNPCQTVMYVQGPICGMGRESCTSEISNAFIFSGDDKYPAFIYKGENGKTISGENRDGQYSYKQELLEVKIEVIGILK